MKKDLKALREKEIRFFDKITGNLIAIKITKQYLRVKVNERSYYFNTDDGKYDGYSDDEVGATTVGVQELPNEIEAISS